jgi:hypothetical protein
MLVTETVEIHRIAPLAGKTELPQLVASGPKPALVAILSAIETELSTAGEFGGYLFREDRDLYLAAGCPNDLCVALSKWIDAHRERFSSWEGEQLTDDDLGPLIAAITRIDTITSVMRRNLRRGTSHAELRENVDELQHFMAEFLAMLGSKQSANPPRAITHGSDSRP